MTRVQKTGTNSKKQSEIKTPTAFSLTTEERLQILANLIIDRILENQKKHISHVSQVKTY